MHNTQVLCSMYKYELRICSINNRHSIHSSRNQQRIYFVWDYIDGDAADSSSSSRKNGRWSYRQQSKGQLNQLWFWINNSIFHSAMICQLQEISHRSTTPFTGTRFSQFIVLCSPILWQRLAAHSHTPHTHALHPHCELDDASEFPDKITFYLRLLLCNGTR